MPPRIALSDKTTKTEVFYQKTKAAAAAVGAKAMKKGEVIDVRTKRAKKNQSATPEELAKHRVKVENENRSSGSRQNVRQTSRGSMAILHSAKRDESGGSDKARIMDFL